MNLKSIILFFLFGIFLFPKQLIAQETEPPTDDLGDVSDAFQENFFEGLKQKGIENYELALEALNKAEKAAKGEKNNQAVVYFEMAKNLKELKRYPQAEQNLEKTLQLVGDRIDVLEELYDLYYQQNDYVKAIPLVQKLIPFDEDYKEDLASLYVRTKQYNQAVTLLDELDASWGESDYRDALRTQVYKITGNTAGQIERLETKIEDNPKSEKEALKLIYLYSEQGENQKAFESAKKLFETNPKSELVHLALYKFYLAEGNAAEALKSMKIVFASNDIDTESKYKVLGDFIQFVNANPTYENELEKVVALFSDENSATVYLKLGEYYFEKGNKEDALKFYELGTTKAPENYNLLKSTVLLQIDFKKFEQAAKLSERAMEQFPAQPLFYLLNGVSNNGLKNSDKAIESLEMGLDFLIDDAKMEKDFYKQLSVAYALKGDSKNAANYANKSADIKTTN